MKEYYSVYVSTDNILSGKHYVPIPDDVLALIKRDFDEDERSNFTSGLPTLYAFMEKYIEETFPHDMPTGEVSFWMESFEPVDMETIMQIPNQPREVDVNLCVGEDHCFQLFLWSAREEIECEGGKLDISCIESPSDDENQCSMRIQIHRTNQLLPHLDHWLHIENLNYPYWNLEGHIEFIEQNINVTTYHCRNSLFPFSIEVTWHMLYLYDGHIPIYKE